MPIYQNSNFEKKSGKLNTSKILDLEPNELVDKQNKIIEKDLLISNNFNKEDSHSSKKESITEKSNPNNLKEKKVISIELTDDEKFVYSQLGINPLIKLGKEYLNVNNTVHLEDNKDKNKKAVLKANKKSKTKLNKKVSNPNSPKDNTLETQIDSEDKNELSEINNEHEEIETDVGLGNSRRKRRRSSASLE